MNKIISVLLLILMSSCKEKATTPSSQASPQTQNKFEIGSYVGLFIFSENGKVDSGKVEMNFTAQNNYQCIPEKALLPPAGGGYYELVKSDRLRLMDNVNYSPNYDGSLTLNGEFIYIGTDTSLLITQRDSAYNRTRRIELKKK